MKAAGFAVLCGIIGVASGCKPDPAECFEQGKRDVCSEMCDRSETRPDYIACYEMRARQVGACAAGDEEACEPSGSRNVDKSACELAKIALTGSHTYDRDVQERFMSHIGDNRDAFKERCGVEYPEFFTQEESAQAGELPKKFEPFTVETLKNTEGLIEAGDALSETRQLDARLGKSIYLNGRTQWWAVAEDDVCWATTMTFMIGESKVESVMPPTEFTAEDATQYEHCVAASGRNKCFRDGGDPGECHDEFPRAG